MNDHAPSPQVIFLSFMVVASGYLISNFFWFGSLILLIATDSLFPEAHRVWGLESEQFKEALAVDPHSVMPISLFWCVLFLGSLGSLIAGFSVVRSAPFSKYGHVVFTATLVAISWLQQLISGKGPNEFRWMILLSMFAMAGGILLGGKIGYREVPSPEPEFIGGE